MKKLTAMLLAMAMLLSLAACGGATGESTEENVEAFPDIGETVQEETPEETSGETTLPPIVEDTSEEAAVSDHPQVMLALTGASDYSDEYSQILCSTYFPSLLLDEASARQWPELQQSLQDLNQEISEDVMSSYRETCAAAESDISYNGELFGSYFVDEEAVVCRADNRMVSIRFYNNGYSGGVHDYYSYWGKNIDAQTGNDLVISDVVTDTDAFEQAVLTELYEQYPDFEEIALNSPEEYVSGLFNDEFIYWTTNSFGINVYFNPYELSSFAAGAQVVTVCYSEYPELFNEAYLPASESFACTLDLYLPCFGDFDGDGQPEELSFMPVWAEDYYEGITVTLGDQSCTVDEYAYDYQPVLFYTPDAGYIVYVFSSGDDDMSGLICLSLNGGTVQEVGYEYLGQGGALGDDENWYTYQFTEPSCMYLSARTDVLGTFSVSRCCSMGTDGMPVPMTDWFVYSSVRVLTAKQDITGTVVDEQGNLSEETEIPSGTEVTPVRTDNESYADVRLPDDSLVRLEVDLSSYPDTVNGINVQDAFDGVMYAG